MSDIPVDVIEAARVLNMRLHSATELGQRTQWIAEAILAERERSRQLLSEADKREREARAKALEEAAAYHDAKVASFLKTAETAIVPSTIERAKLAAVFHEASASSIRALHSEER